MHSPQDYRLGQVCLVLIRIHFERRARREQLAGRCLVPQLAHEAKRKRSGVRLGVKARKENDGVAANTGDVRRVLPKQKGRQKGGRGVLWQDVAVVCGPVG